MLRSKTELQTGPLHPILGPSTRSKILKLGVENSTRGRRPHPGKPPLGVNETVHHALQENCSRVILPGPAQERAHPGQIFGRPHGAVLDGQTGVLVRVELALRSDGVLLAGHGLLGQDIAVLEDDRGVAEDEVHRPVDRALAVELAVGVCVECVLECVHGAPVEERLIGRRH